MRIFAYLDIILRVVLALSGLIILGTAWKFAGFSLENPIPSAFSNKDFANYWIAGKLVVTGGSADLFGLQTTYFKHMTDAFGAGYPWHAWSYPPHYLLLVWWTGYFGYATALWLFIAVTLVPFLYAVRRFTGRMDLNVILMMLPFIAVNFFAVQNGFISAALALGALGWRSSQPVLAGILLGLLTIKPQLGFLFPLLLLAERRWTMLASSVATIIVLIAVSAMLFGIDAWKSYFEHVIPYQAGVMKQGAGFFLSMLTSFYGALRNLGTEYSAAITAHAIFAVPIAIATVVAFFKVQDGQDRAILLIIGTFLISPYALSYDMGLVSAAATLIAIKGGGSDPSKDPFRVLATLTALLPLAMIGFGLAGIPVAPVILLSLYALVYVRSGALRR